MKKLPCCIGGLVLVVIAICSPAWPQTGKPHEGMEPYVPTRIEWLELELSATLRVDLSLDSEYAMDFVGDSARDTIEIVVKYLPTVNREIMNRSIDTAKKIIFRKAESHGWSSWLKVKESVEMIKRK